eukprot:4974838-Amphidinium_carterae.1
MAKEIRALKRAQPFPPTCTRSRFSDMQRIRKKLILRSGDLYTEAEECKTSRARGSRGMSLAAVAMGGQRFLGLRSVDRSADPLPNSSSTSRLQL